MVLHAARFRAWLALAALAAPFFMAASATAADRWDVSSNSGRYEAVLEPRSGSVRVGTLQEWVLTLRSEDGAPVQNVRIGIGGGMPGHGHGLPTQPVATEYLGDGRHVIAGVKLSMPGEWLIAVGLESHEHRDRLMFEMSIQPWRDDRHRLLGSLMLDAGVRAPPSPSNRVADDPAAAEFGERLFFDRRLSADASLSCASCHRPELYFTDGLPRGKGIRQTARNTPTVIGAAHLDWFYWDGRRDSLWSQALLPLEAPDEMGSDRVAVVRLIAADEGLRQAYERVFGALPMLEGSTMPENAGPLSEGPARDAWHRMSRRERQTVNSVFANIGKAIAAYERGLPAPVTRFDRYAAAVLDGKDAADGLLTSEERAGLDLFLDAEKTHCLRCHNGKWFTNGDFHNVGTGNFTGERLDFGRVFGVRALMADEFNCLGPYSDARPEQCGELRFLNRSSHVPLEGAFKVPGLRNVANTSPYMHDGRFSDLESVIDFYRNPPLDAREHELVPLDISDQEAGWLVAFLESLSILED